MEAYKNLNLVDVLALLSSLLFTIGGAYLTIILVNVDPVLIGRLTINDLWAHSIVPLLLLAIGITSHVLMSFFKKGRILNDRNLLIGIVFALLAAAITNIVRGVDLALSVHTAVAILLGYLAALFQKSNKLYLVGIILLIHSVVTAVVVVSKISERKNIDQVCLAQCEKVSIILALENLIVATDDAGKTFRVHNPSEVKSMKFGK